MQFGRRTKHRQLTPGYGTLWAFDQYVSDNPTVYLRVQKQLEGCIASSKGVLPEKVIISVVVGSFSNQDTVQPVGSLAKFSCRELREADLVTLKTEDTTWLIEDKYLPRLEKP